jgi:hypothetical protein
MNMEMMDSGPPAIDIKDMMKGSKTEIMRKVFKYMFMLFLPAIMSNLLGINCECIAAKCCHNPSAAFRARPVSHVPSCQLTPPFPPHFVRTFPVCAASHRRRRHH